MKNPNGYGTIKKLAGNRRRPYALIVSDGGRRMVVSYHETRGTYTPHDTRHTFASLLDAAEVNENARRRLLGHAGGNVTDDVYTHKTMRQLRAAVEKIK